MNEISTYKLTAEDIAFCTVLRLEEGVDDDDEDKHQYTHICWPYTAWEGSLCKSDRLWGHIRVVSEKSKIDCAACVSHLCTLRFEYNTRATPIKELFVAFGKLAGAVETLAALRDAANNLVDFNTNMGGEGKLFPSSGYTYPALFKSVQTALDVDHARHCANIGTKPPKT